MREPEKWPAKKTPHPQWCFFVVEFHYKLLLLRFSFVSFLSLSISHPPIQRSPSLVFGFGSLSTTPSALVLSPSTRRLRMQSLWECRSSSPPRCANNVKVFVLKTPWRKSRNPRKNVVPPRKHVVRSETKTDNLRL